MTYGNLLFLYHFYVNVVRLLLLNTFCFFRKIPQAQSLESSCAAAGLTDPSFSSQSSSGRAIITKLHNHPKWKMKFCHK